MHQVRDWPKQNKRKQNPEAVSWRSGDEPKPPVLPSDQLIEGAESSLLQIVLCGELLSQPSGIWSWWTKLASQLWARHFQALSPRVLLYTKWKVCVCEDSCNKWSWMSSGQPWRSRPREKNRFSNRNGKSKRRTCEGKKHKRTGGKSFLFSLIWKQNGFINTVNNRKREPVRAFPELWGLSTPIVYRWMSFQEKVIWDSWLGLDVSM